MKKNMKTLNIKGFILFAAAIIMFTACEENDFQPVVGNFDAPVLKSSSVSELTITEETQNDTLIAFDWDAADYGFPAAVIYTIQFDNASNNFSNPGSFGTTGKTSVSYTGNTINQALLNMGMPANEAADLEIRIKAELHETLDTLYSETMPLTVTPFKKEKRNYFVVGQHIGWDNKQAQRMYKDLPGQQYERYLYLPAVDQGFKILPDSASWDGDLGDDPANPGMLIADDENNMTVSEPGFWLLKIDMADMTWEANKAEWGVIGSATPTGWDSDTDFVYDETEDVLKVTLDLTAGEIKFRANDDWTLNYGDVDGDNVLDTENDNNISVPEAGNYTIILDFNPPEYTYQLIKN
jgi:starch-binding outer membrane protein SusE/F